MVNFVDINNETEFLFYLIRNISTKYVEVWMKYKDSYYNPLFSTNLGIKSITKNKLLSLNMCNDYITRYVYKERYYVTLENNPNVIQTISIKRSNITVKLIK